MAPLNRKDWDFAAIPIDGREWLLLDRSRHDPLWFDLLDGPRFSGKDAPQ